jgi:hypothetical protein
MYRGEYFVGSVRESLGIEIARRFADSGLVPGETGESLASECIAKSRPHAAVGACLFPRPENQDDRRVRCIVTGEEKRTAEKIVSLAKLDILDEDVSRMELRG